MNNEIGELGEAIFNVKISKDYIFRPKQLGDKWPTSDFFVELNGLNNRFFFIVQVKSTAQGFDNNGNLKIILKKNKLRELNSYYCPTYLAGVDINSETVFIMPINKNKRKDISKLPSKYKLDSTMRQKLFEDVKNFWENTNIKVYKNSFKHKI
jgi:hypothetical protein